MARHYVNPNRPDPLDRAVDDLSLQQWAREDAARQQALNGGPPQRRATAVGLSVREPSTYSRFKDSATGPPGTMFFRDLVASYLFKDPEARRRLDQHHQEQLDGPHGRWLRAAASSGNFSGLEIPGYVTNEYGYAAAAGRPFADAMAHRDLPPTGLTVNMPVGTTPTQVAVQTENAAAASGAMTGTMTSLNVQTSAGSIQLSRQAVDRSNTAVDETVMTDLLLRWGTNLDNQLLNAATVGLAAVAPVTAQTTPSAATGSAVYTAICGACALVENAMGAVGHPTVVVMRGGRWHWLASQGLATPLLISTATPSLPWAGPQSNPGGPWQQGQGFAGALPNGLPVVTDNSVVSNLGVSSNQDQIYVCAGRQMLLYEPPAGQPAGFGAETGPGGLLFVRAEQAQAAAIAVTLTAYSYWAASMARYPGATAAVSGANMVVPTGF